MGILNPNHFIIECADWDTFFERVSALDSSQEKGLLFDRLTQLFLQVTPKYRSKLRNVWLRSEIPEEVRKRLNLPVLDEGIDQIAERPLMENFGLYKPSLELIQTKPSLIQSSQPSLNLLL